MLNAMNIRIALGNLLVTLVLICSMTTLAMAQTTTPAAPEKNKQPADRSTTMTQQQPGQGWVWWDDALGRDMNITPERLRELRAVDERYRKEYNALGSSPWTSEKYGALTERRNAEIQKLLTPEQYKDWTRRTATKITTPATPDR